jgi:transcriptional regulator with XRE-family HTH domain
MSVSTLLQDEFERRRARNARYSLRAFARGLDIDHSTLSQMMRGKRTIPDRTLEKLAKQLGVTRDELERRCEIERFDDVVLRAIAGGAEASSVELAAQIGAGVDQVNIALHRLLRLGFLAMQGNSWSVSKGALS